MRIKFIEIQNFRKLKSIRIDFSEEKTLFVGANNSGKTSAMVALRKFLIDQNNFSTNDFTLSNWKRINQIGQAWEDLSSSSNDNIVALSDWEDTLPTMDVWLDVAQNEIHYVQHLLPSLDWEGGVLGVRLQLEPKEMEKLYKEFLIIREQAEATIEAAKNANKEREYKVTLWPSCMRDFLERGLSNKFCVRSYILDPEKLVAPVNGIARPQTLPEEAEYIEESPFAGLIRINEIDAQRGFSDANAQQRFSDDGNEENSVQNDKLKLSRQLRSYYSKHLDPSDMPEPSDVDALEAIHEAQTLFDERLKDGFGKAFEEVEGLGYPGFSDPKLAIMTRIKPMDGLNHSSALQYEVISHQKDAPETPPRLPEQYNGLGYQNLISMIFRLMSFRDDWMQVGKVGKRAEAKSGETFFPPPLHLVLIEEPEAHLHVQVQQVFIRKAYEVLRSHEELENNKELSTQLIVSSHSSHIAHECEFASLRYFRRKPAINIGDVPMSTVVNLSEVFGEQDETARFVTRYLKSTHCDIFFADAAIVIEGAAERMLVPHFIRENFPELNQSYLTLLEIGGSHAHRFRPLIEHLGLNTLIISDIDAADGTGNKPSKPTSRGENQVSRNSTLKAWLPKKDKIDDLLDAVTDHKTKAYDECFAVRVAYQTPIKITLDKAVGEIEITANTFEDALVYENLSIFKKLEGDGLLKKFKISLNQYKNATDLNAAMFNDLKSGSKAAFALDLLFLKEPSTFSVPTYIHEGLSWLQDQVSKKKLEILPKNKKTSPEKEVA